MVMKRQRKMAMTTMMMTTTTKRRKTMKTPRKKTRDVMTLGSARPLFAIRPHSMV